MSETPDLAYFNLVAEIVRKCFTPLGHRKNSEMIRKERCDFANDGKLLKLFCDCSNNFEYEKLKTLIVLFNQVDNTNYTKEIKKINQKFLSQFNLKHSYATSKIDKGLS